jgi:hypothetical protein
MLLVDVDALCSGISRISGFGAKNWREDISD